MNFGELFSPFSCQCICRVEMRSWLEGGRELSWLLHWVLWSRHEVYPGLSSFVLEGCPFFSLQSMALQEIFTLSKWWQIQNPNIVTKTEIFWWGHLFWWRLRFFSHSVASSGQSPRQYTTGFQSNKASPTSMKSCSSSVYSTTTTPCDGWNVLGAWIQ